MKEKEGNIRRRRMSYGKGKGPLRLRCCEVATRDRQKSNRNEWLHA